MAAVHYVVDLIAGDNPAKYRGHPVVVRGNQKLPEPCAVPMSG